MILKGSLGEIFSGIDRYAMRAQGARMLASNFGGDTIAERMREATALRSSRPNLKKIVGHIILSHDPTLTDLSDEQWMVALEIARQEHDLRDAAYCAVLHVEKKHQHLHLYYVRCRPDGSLVSDSQSYRKNEAAARRIERELGLPPPTPVPKADKVGDRQASDNATRRGRRKQKTEGEPFMETTELRRLAFEALAASTSVQAFNRELAERGIEAQWTANHAGIKYLPIGASTALKGSSASRDLSAGNVMATLQRNADLRQAAEQASAAVIGVADDRAKALTATRVDRGEALDDITAATGITSRALPETEAEAARALATAGPDPLSFLVIPEVVPLVLDDAPFSIVAAGESPSADDDGDADARARREQALAHEDLTTQLRAMTSKQLIELRNSAKRPLDDAVIALALWEKLLALAIRILSLGVVSKGTPISALLAQRQTLADAAEDEISRRHRSPATATERMRSLAEHEAALNSRRIVLDAQRTVVKLATLNEPAGDLGLRERVTVAFDAAQSKDGQPTTKMLKSDLRANDAAIAALEVQAPSSIARLRRAAAVQEWDRKMARAKELRALTAERLQKFFDSIQRVVEQQEAAKAAKAAEANGVLLAEAEALSIEIRDRVPALRVEIERDAMHERLRGIGDADDDVSRMR